MTLVKIHEAETDLSKLIERAEAGEEIVIARGDTPVVKLTLVAHPKKERVPGLMRGKWPDLPDAFFFDPLPEDELKLWEGGDESIAR
jgi:antitoxin (DNA-binding transcriptional repressor) of toxin-antitoxin stability system